MLKNETSGQSNLTTGRIAAAWMVQWYSPGCASVHPSDLIRASLGPLESKSQTASRSVKSYLHSSPRSIPILHNGPPSSKLSIPLWGSGPPSNTYFLRPTRVLNLNGMSIGLDIFARRTIVAYRPTDRQTTLLGL